MKKEKSTYLIVFLLITAFCNIQAKNKVTIASIGTEKPYFENDEDPQEIVDKMIEFWGSKIKQVLMHKPDLIVLPEVCDHPNGFSGENRTTYYMVRKNQIWDYFASEAKTNSCYIAFGTRRKDEQGVWRNSCVVLDRMGKTVGVYDKNFPTIDEMQEGIVAGTEVPLFQCDFGSVAGVICFDLNFNELQMQYKKAKPDIILFPSMYHGGLAQSNWAYSCRAYFVSSCGLDDLPTEIRNPLGDVIASSTNYFHYAVAKVNLDSRLVHLDGNWNKFVALKEKYGEYVTISDPGKLGSVLLTSEHELISANDMIKEFDIEVLDAYLQRSRELRLKQIENKY